MVLGLLFVHTFSMEMAVWLAQLTMDVVAMCGPGVGILCSFWESVMPVLALFYYSILIVLLYGVKRAVFWSSLRLCRYGTTAFENPEIVTQDEEKNHRRHTGSSMWSDCSCENHI
jgi:hypothetical protein